MKNVDVINNCSYIMTRLKHSLDNFISLVLDVLPHVQMAINGMLSKAFKNNKVYYRKIKLKIQASEKKNFFNSIAEIGPDVD